jgi:glycosyltransferase involved in cell wall biosynthesis
MRVAFGIIGGSFWTGGLNYIESLVSALHDHQSAGITPVLFATPDADAAALDRLSRFLTEPPHISPAWRRSGSIGLARKAAGAVLQRDLIAERALRRMAADAVFQTSVWYGMRFRIPTVAWIPDFQHRACPSMFTWRQRITRDLGYRLLSYSANALMVSSNTAREDCLRLFPRAAARCHPLPFVPRQDPLVPVDSLGPLLERYGLPRKFLFLPNQLWRHKNHLAVIAALRLMQESPDRPVIVACGNPDDYRNPDHPKRVIAEAASPDVAEHFRFLGMIPRQDLSGLMRLSAATVNPSLFEGWSTTVEESKALGVPLLLSDIPVHREQAGDRARYFDPYSVESIASALRAAWQAVDAGPRPDAEAAAQSTQGHARAVFAEAFASIVRAAVADCTR